MSSWDMPVWDTYVSTITGATTNPTKGTITKDIGAFLLHGASMHLSYTYEQSALGANGAGDYAWSLPAGVSIDLALQPVGTVVGSVSGIIPTFWHLHGMVKVASATTLKLLLVDDSRLLNESLLTVSSTWFKLVGAIQYTFNAALAVE